MIAILSILFFMAQQEGKKQITATFKGTSGDGYDSGLEYALLMWEENGMVFLSRIDGNGLVAYDSMESVKANWDMGDKKEEAKTDGKKKIVATFKGSSGSEGYETDLDYQLYHWVENGMQFISLIDGRGQVAYDSMNSLKANWEIKS